MRILALILARGGSKRLPRKNCRFLGGKPLVTWSIDVVKGVSKICDLLVSTDDPEIASICSDAGALVPWLRPAELATDTTSSLDAALHALDWYETKRGRVDGLLLLQPTSPFRTQETIINAINLYLQKNSRPILAVSLANIDPARVFKIENEFLKPFMDSRLSSINLQDSSNVYTPNGSLYLIAPSELRDKKTFIPENSLPLIIESRKEALDIDTEWDWLIAQALVANS